MPPSDEANVMKSMRDWPPSQQQGGTGKGNGSRGRSGKRCAPLQLIMAVPKGQWGISVPGEEEVGT